MISRHGLEEAASSDDELFRKGNMGHIKNICMEVLSQFHILK
jgi:hypothetical protein